MDKKSPKYPILAHPRLTTIQSQNNAEDIFSYTTAFF
jgi:hypothetical protein